MYHVIYRKWFQNPVRKLSQGKIEKGEKSPIGQPTTPKGVKGGKGSKFSPFKVGVRFIDTGGIFHLMKRG